MEEAKKREREEREYKQQELHGPEPFNPAQIKTNLKYQYPFLGKDEFYTHSFLLSEDPYDSTKDERLRAKWIDEAKQLFGEFKPQGIS